MKWLGALFLVLLCLASTRLFSVNAEEAEVSISKYNVKLTSFDESTFTAELEMDLKIKNFVNEAVFELDSSPSFSNFTCKATSSECILDEKGSKLILTLSKSPQKTAANAAQQKLKVTVTYQGSYSRYGLFFMKSGSNLIYTANFQRNFFHYVFPCQKDFFDKFDITTTVKEMIVLSNLESFKDKKFLEDRIDFVIGKFIEVCKDQSKTESNGAFKTYAFKDKKEKSLGCKITHAAFKFLKNIISTTRTMSQIVVENWRFPGIAPYIITHSESDFYLNKAENTASDQRKSVSKMITSIIYHFSIEQELTNLGRFLKNFVIDKIAKDTSEDYAMMDEFMLSVHNYLFELDTSHYLEKKVEINLKEKDKALIRTIEAIDEEGFWMTIPKCLRQEDGVDCLIEELQEAKKIESIEEFGKWRNSSYPVLHVEVKGKGNYLFTQESFDWSGNLSEAIWHIPVTYTTDEKLHNLHWMKDKETNFTLSNTTLKLLNYRQTGYYRVNYDQQMWKDIIAQLKSNLTVIDRINRAQLIDDVFSLARSTANFSKDTPDYGTAFKLLDYIEHEEDYIPLSAAFTAFSFLETKLYGGTEYDRFKSHVKTIIAKVYDNLKINMTDIPMDYLDRMRFKLVSLWACRLEHRACVDNAVKLYEKYLDGEYQLHPDLEDIVYCAAARESIQFARIITVEKDHAPEDRKLFYNGVLSCSKYEKHIERLVKENLISGDMDLMEIMKGNPGNFEIVANYMKKNYKEIVNKEIFWVLLSIYKFSNAKVSEEMKTFIDKSRLKEEDKLYLKKLFETTVTWNSTKVKSISQFFDKTSDDSGNSADNQKPVGLVLLFVGAIQFAKNHIFNL